MNKLSVAWDSLIPFLNTQGQYIYVVMSGQSNAVGNSTGGDMTIDENVEVWNTSTGEWETASSSNVHDVAQNGELLNYNNIGWQFCKILSMHTGRKIRFVISAHGGESITEWETTSSSQYLLLNSAIVASGIPHIDYFLWHQGEADVSMDVDVYKGKLDSFIDNLSAEEYWDRLSVFLAGQLKKSGGQNAQNSAINRLEIAGNNSISVIEALGLTDAGDAHFTGEQIDDFAKRYFHKAMGRGWAVLENNGDFYIPGNLDIQIGKGIKINGVSQIQSDSNYTYFKIPGYFEKSVIFSDASFKFLALPEYADNAAAVAGGLSTDKVYKTATGELRIVV